MAVTEAPVSRRSAAGKAGRSPCKLDPPPLENGDRLTRLEFERRYFARPDIGKAELIEGIVHMPSPVRFASHGEPHSWILTWLGIYSAFTPGVRVADNATVRLDADNEPQPDALLRIEPEAGGSSRLGDDDYVEGAPELIVEIAGSSVARDLHEKRRAYLRNGVREYVVWRVHDGALDWFGREDGDYVPLVPDAAGTIVESRTFPGLRLAVDALLAGEMDRVLAEQQAGIGTPQHAEFVAAMTADRTGA